MIFALRRRCQRESLPEGAAISAKSINDLMWTSATRRRVPYYRPVVRQSYGYRHLTAVAIALLNTYHSTSKMARGVEGNEMSTPRPSQKKQPSSVSQSGKGQKSILGFFQKKSTNSPSSAPSDVTPVQKTPTSKIASKAFTKPSAAITPVPSSDAPDYSSPIKQDRELTVGRNKENGLSLLASQLGSFTEQYFQK